jgi:apolipoprotein D and lipocalin family protein
MSAMAYDSQADAKAVTTVSSVDLARYAGDWFEVARYPNWFQKKCAGDVKATYAQRPDGRIDVTNRCRTADGKTTAAAGIARVVDETTRAKLKVRFAPSFLSFLPFVWGDYWIIALDEQYRWAVVGSPDRNYLWILSRTPALDQALFDKAVAQAGANGFDASRLQRTSQTARN